MSANNQLTANPNYPQMNKEETSIPVWLAETVKIASLIKNNEIDPLCDLLNNAKGDEKIIYIQRLANARDRIVNLSRRYRGYLTVDNIETLDKYLQAQARQLKKETGIKISVAKNPVGLLNVLFVDTETTGLEYEDEPIGIGIVLAEVNRHTGEIVREIASYAGLREPKRAISPGAFAVHGLKKAKLRGEEFDYEIMTRMFMHSNLCIAHNASFDKRMLRHFLTAMRNHLPETYVPAEWACSCWDIEWPIQFRNRKLDTICLELGVPRSIPHRAMDDVRAVINVLKHKASDGAPYLAKLLGQHRIQGWISRY